MFRAFSTLAASRPYLAGAFGTVPGAIPLSEIQTYCALFDVGDVEDFTHLIRAMDEAYLSRIAERRNKTSKKGRP